MYTVYVIWTFCCTGNKAFMKVSQYFIGPQILNYEISLACPWGDKAVLLTLDVMVSVLASSAVDFGFES